jgi:hypothetical protein
VIPVLPEALDLLSTVVFFSADAPVAAFAGSGDLSSSFFSPSAGPELAPAVYFLTSSFLDF